LVKSHLRLDHPELGEMPRCVGILRTKCGTESVNLADAARKGFNLQLAAHRQISSLGEKVLGEIAFAILARQLIDVQAGDLEHLPVTFAIAAGDDRRVNVKETLFLKEIVNRFTHTIAQPGNGTKRVGPRPQMSDAAQELEGMALLLQ